MKTKSMATAERERMFFAKRGEYITMQSVGLRRVLWCSVFTFLMLHVGLVLAYFDIYLDPQNTVELLIVTILFVTCLSLTNRFVRV